MVKPMGYIHRFDLYETPFAAPEVVNFDEINSFTDMWSVGVICYVLLSGLSPFQGETDIDTMTNVTLGKYNFDDDAFKMVSNTAKDFIRRLLQMDQWFVHKFIEWETDTVYSFEYNYFSILANVFRVKMHSSIRG